MALGTFMPVMIAPMLGSIISSVSSIATGAVSTGVLVSGLNTGKFFGNVGHTVDNMSQPSSSGISIAKAAFPPSSLAKISKSGLGGAKHTASSALELSHRFDNYWENHKTCSK